MAPFAALLDSIGAPTERLLSQSHIPLALLEDQEAFVPLNLAYRFVERSARAEGIDDFGRVVAERTTSFELGAYGKSLESASTVLEYLRLGIRLIGSVTGGQKIWLSTEQDRVRVSQCLPGLPGPGRCQGDLYSLVVTINTLRRFFGPDWHPDEVRLLAGVEGVVGDYSIFGDARVFTEQPYSSFTIPNRLVFLPFPNSLRPSGQGGTALSGAEPTMPKGFQESVELLVQTLLWDGYPDVHLAAEAAGMSPRTLQRRLAEIGLTYSQVVKGCRVRLAAEWLAESDSAIAEIAASLGYTSAANFARAFRQQTGMSPSFFRLAGQQEQ